MPCPGTSPRTAWTLSRRLGVKGLWPLAMADRCPGVISNRDARSFMGRPWRRAAARNALSGLPVVLGWDSLSWPGFGKVVPSCCPLRMALALSVVSVRLMLVVVMSLPPKNSERGRLRGWETTPLVCKFVVCRWRLICPPWFALVPKRRKRGRPPKGRPTPLNVKLWFDSGGSMARLCRCVPPGACAGVARCPRRYRRRTHCRPRWQDSQRRTPVEEWRKAQSAQGRYSAA